MSPTSIFRLLFTLHPVALATAYVLALFAASPGLPQVLWRPLLTAVLVALAIHVVMAVILRDRYRSAVAASLAVLVLAGLWPVALLALVPFAWVVLRRALGRSRHAAQLPSAQRLSAGLSLFGGVAFAIAAGTAIVADLDRFLTPQGLPHPEAQPAAADLPDIYIVWLDGYPRADTLAETFGYDNQPFLAELDRRGFTVSPQARSNYAMTWLTMSSMLHMEYVHDQDELSPPADDPIGQFKQLRRAVNGGPAVFRLANLGYRVVSSIGSFTDAGFTRAHLVLDDGQLNQFEEQLMRLSMVARIVDFAAADWFAEQARSRVESTLDHLQAISGRRDDEQPVFMIAQVMAPHAPFVSSPEGPMPAPECHPASCFLWETEIDDLGLSEPEYATRLRDYVEFTNIAVLSTLDTVMRDRPEAVVIVMSDHGSRYSDMDVDESFRTLFAARTPGHPALFEPDVSPVNVVRTLFRAYVGDDLPDLPYRAWRNLNSKPLDLVPYP